MLVEQKEGLWNNTASTMFAYDMKLRDDLTATMRMTVYSVKVTPKAVQMSDQGQNKGSTVWGDGMVQLIGMLRQQTGAALQSGVAK